MTTTPPDAPPPQEDTGPRVTRDEVRDLGRLRRSRADRKVAGVAGGLGRHLDVDPLVLRVAFVVLTFFGGAGLIVYGACWLLVPEDGSDDAAVNLDERTRTMALVVIGALAAIALVGDSWGAFGFPWPLIVIGLVVLWVLSRNNPRGSRGSDTQGRAPAAAYAPTGAPAQTNPYDTTSMAAPTSSAAPAAPAIAPLKAPTPPRPVNPRKRGPILFWFTLALIALAEGVLGMVDLAGVGVAGPAYPALAVAICGVMLVVGAFFGRAGGIIVVGLVASLALVGSTAASQAGDTDTVRITPVSASSVQDRYWLGAGEQIVDLRQVRDLAALDDRRIEIDGGAGRIEVLLPSGLDVSVVAAIDGPGHTALFGEEHGGIGVQTSYNEGSGTSDPHIVLDTHLGVGEIEVRQP